MTVKNNALGYQLVCLHWAVTLVPGSDTHITQPRCLTDSDNWQHTSGIFLGPNPENLRAKYD